MIRLNRDITKHNLSRVVRIFAYAKTKTQISFAVTAKLISAFVFATQLVQFLSFLNTKFKPLAIFCGRTAWFKSDRVGNLEDRFSHNKAHLSFAVCNDVTCKTQTGNDTSYSPKIDYQVIPLISVNIVPSLNIEEYELVNVRRYPNEGQYPRISV